MVRAASLDAYRMSEFSGINSMRKIEILRCVRSNPKITRNEISEKTGLPINIVSGRVSDLKDEGLLVEHERELTPFSKVKIGRVSIQDF